MEDLVLEKQDSAVQAALKEHFGTVARVRGRNEDVEEKDTVSSAPETPAATPPPAQDEASAHESPRRHWTLLAVCVVSALIAFGAGLAVGWFVARSKDRRAT